MLNFTVIKDHNHNGSSNVISKRILENTESAGLDVHNLTVMELTLAHLTAKNTIPHLSLYFCHCQ
jgi:DUF1365 family protein